MKSHTVYLTFNTQKRKEIIPITNEVERIIRESGIQEGLALVSAIHITAAIIVNDEEPGLWHDIMDWVERLAPENPNYLHHRTGEENGDAHLKNLLLHSQVMLPITEGRFDAGPWQRIFYCEFDGQRPKRVIAKVIGEEQVKSMTEHLWAIVSKFMNHREKPLHKDESFQSSNCKRALQAVSK